jgi:hypothetical protein
MEVVMLLWVIVALGYKYNFSGLKSGIVNFEVLD